MAAETKRTSDDDDDVVESGTASPLPKATAVPAADAVPDEAARRRRLLGWSVFGMFLAGGWVLILWANHFTLSAPTVFVCLGYLALLSAGYALLRTGIEVVIEDPDEVDSTWGRPLGRRTELEREKKTLLKAIKEAEFDREMGKLSKADADEMIAVYRVRAIEVIKELDQMDTGAAGSVREQIERELKARLELDAKADKAKADALADATKDKKKREAHKKGSKPAKDAEAKAETKPAKDAEANADAKAEANADAKAETNADVKAETKADVKAETKADVKAEINTDAKVETKPDAVAEAAVTDAAKGDDPASEARS